MPLVLLQFAICLTTRFFFNRAHYLLFFKTEMRSRNASMAKLIKSWPPPRFSNYASK